MALAELMDWSQQPFLGGSYAPFFTNYYLHGATPLPRLGPLPALTLHVYLVRKMSDGLTHLPRSEH